MNDRQEVTAEWGNAISEERLNELHAQQAVWEADHAGKRGPFDQVKLTGADVFWLAAIKISEMLSEDIGTSAKRLRRTRYPDYPPLSFRPPDLNLQGAILCYASLKGACLESMCLQGANLRDSHMENCSLMSAQLDEADLSQAHLEGARLNTASLKNAVLRRAWMDRADLSNAHLEGALMEGVRLPGGSLAGAYFDEQTKLEGALVAGDSGAIRVVDAHWGNVSLALIDWRSFTDTKRSRKHPFGTHMLIGEEQIAVVASKERKQHKPVSNLTPAYQSAARANRQLSLVFHSLGMSDEADHFAYRAQITQRNVFREQRARGKYLFSWILFLLAGYGYRPLRTLGCYVGSLLVFAVMYLLASAGALTFGLPPTQFHGLVWYEALILSISSFHGRGFFQPVHSLGDPVAIIAAIEAVWGLLIEVSFIATFTQRFFGR